ncbi:MarR family winged helix-turn-helix transcriptional regulator [Saccharothrix saharensis]|uniref:MarR family winged helix-turn-helix transcriptional regulator n=1 Tax=Saccharothrix saharensis TaxID=571190 RepID=UPI0036C4E9B3
MNRIRRHRSSDEVLHVLTEVVEHLEVLWERSREVSPAPLSASQLRAMFVLDRGEGMNLRALTEALDSTPPSMSRLCDRLQAVGFLERVPSATSRREVVLRLSERGRTYLDGLRERRQEHLRGLIDVLPPDARAALVDGLTPLRDAVVARQVEIDDPDSRTA